MEILTSILQIIGGVVTGGGGLYAAFGAIQLGTALKDHQGPAIGSALWQLAGAACIILAGALILNVNFS